MFFKYPLTNDDTGPHIETDINIKDVNIKIISSNKEVFNEKFILGFWRDTSKLNQVVDCIEELKITSNIKESELLVFGAINEYASLFDIKQIPYGFEVDGGLYSTAEDKEENIVRKLITHTPVWVPYQYYNCDSDSMMLDLAFYNKNNRLSIVTIPQKDAFQRRGIMEVSAHGALLEEAKAGQMINWLVNYIHHNDIPVHSVFERFGWKEDLSFVAGSQMISDKKTESVKIINVPDKSIQGLSSSGTTEDWIQCTRKILQYDKARLKCYAACTAPLLKLLNQKSFILHDYGESATGKTKTSELAMSIWGDPAKLLMSAFGTAVGKERLATIFTDLPIFIDETQVSTEDDNKAFIYLIANETGKLRGLKDGGLQDTASWKTVAFTTGEAPLTSDKTFTGVSMRAVEIYGGLGAHDKEAIDDFKLGVENCYGLLGPYIIQEIIDNYSDLPKFFNQLNAKFNILASELHTSLNGIGGRAASMFAVLALGGLIFEEVIEKLGGESKGAPEICAEVYREYIDTMSQSGYSSKAYEHFISWYHTKEKYFLQDMMQIDGRGPYDLYGNATDDYIDIYPTILKDVLENAGFNYKRVIKDWIDEELVKIYTDTNGKEYSNYTVKFFNKAKKVKRIVIKDVVM